MRQLLLAFLIFLIPLAIFAQDDLMNMINQDPAKDINYTTATFKSTRIINGHSIERMVPGQLDVRIEHRFGTINSGAYELWGIDQSANIYLGLEYGILKWLMIGIGRERNEKLLDGFAKFTVLRQSTGAKVMPVSLTVFSSVTIKTQKFIDPAITNYFSSRLSYVAQVLVARKFNQSFSFQLTPSYVHRNMVGTELDPNDLFALGAGGRIKLNKRISFNAEYYYVANPKTYMSTPVYNPLSVGVDLETGGHVFTLLLTNSVSMLEKGFIGETTGSWKNGGVHFGFNISRVFTLKKHEKPLNY